MDNEKTQSVSIRVPDNKELGVLCAAAADGNDPAVAEWVNGHGREHINRKNFYGWTALMAAAREGRESTVRLLLSLGAQADIKDDHGKTAADYARKMRYDDVAFLIDQGWEQQKLAAIKAEEERLKQETLDWQRDLKKRAPKFDLK